MTCINILIFHPLTSLERIQTSLSYSKPYNFYINYSQFLFYLGGTTDIVVLEKLKDGKLKYLNTFMGALIVL
jgi:hypothetical protein